MAQTLKSKVRGNLRFRKTWRQIDGRHIGALVGGGYAHTSGLLVEKKQDLLDLITPEEVDERQKAIDWWENKDVSLDEESRPKGVLISSGGDCMWDDGTPIESAQSIIENLPKGDLLETVLAWFHKKQKLEKINEKIDAENRDLATQKNVRKQRKRNKK